VKSIGVHKYAPDKPGVYLRLFHGRTPPDEELHDWGADGPHFGPLQWAHTTYMSEIKLAALGSYDTNLILPIKSNLVVYDGMYYGDWSVYLVQDQQGILPL